MVPPHPAVTATDKKKPSRQRFFLSRVLVFLTFLASVAAVLFFLQERLLKARAIEARLAATLEETLQGKFSYEKFKLHYFPFLGMEFKNTRFDFQENPKWDLEAKKLSVSLNPWLALFGKTQISGVEVHEGDFKIPLPSQDLFDYPYLHLEKVSLDLGAFELGKSVDWKLKADLGEQAKALEGEGKLTLPQKEMSLEQMALQAELTLDDFPMHAGLHFSSVGRKWQILSGELQGRVSLQKEAEATLMAIDSDLKFQDFVYEVGGILDVERSQPLEGNWTAVLEWNFQTEELSIERSSLDSPMGQFNIGGRFFLPTERIQGYAHCRPKSEARRPA